jgi:putative transposase
MALTERITFYEISKTTISYRQQQNALPSVKKYFPRYKTVYSKVLQMTLKKLDNAYKSFFALYKKTEKEKHQNNISNHVRQPNFRNKDYFFTLTYNQSGFKIRGTDIQFSHKIPVSEGGSNLTFSLPSNFKYHTYIIKQVEIMFDSLRKRWYICLTKSEPEISFYDNGKIQTWDLGLNEHVAVNMNGKFFRTKVKRFDKYWIPQIQVMQAKRDRCRKRSQRWYRYNRVVNRYYRKMSNQIKNFQHVQSKRLIEQTQATTIVVGDLKSKKMAQDKRTPSSVHRAVYNTGSFGRFIFMLVYKGQRIGKRVIKLNEAYTTVTCACCQTRKKFIPLSQRVFSCDNSSCPHTCDRDENSVVNLMVRYLSKNASWTCLEGFWERLGYHTGFGRQNLIPNSFSTYDTQPKVKRKFLSKITSIG